LIPVWGFDKVCQYRSASLCFYPGTCTLCFFHHDITEIMWHLTKWVKADRAFHKVNKSLHALLQMNQTLHALLQYEQNLTYALLQCELKLTWPFTKWTQTYMAFHKVNKHLQPFTKWVKDNSVQILINIHIQIRISVVAEDICLYYPTLLSITDRTPSCQVLAFFVFWCVNSTCNIYCNEMNNTFRHVAS